MNPDGAAIDVDVEARSTVLLFLTASCYSCRPLWEGAVGHYRADAPRLPVVIVTPSPSTESARLVAALAPGATQVVMSSEVWHAYGVTRAPWCVVVEDGKVTGDALAPGSWPELEVLRGHERA